MLLRNERTGDRGTPSKPDTGPTGGDFADVSRLSVFSFVWPLRADVNVIGAIAPP